MCRLRLAHFLINKWEVLDDKEKDFELGCGDGNDVVVYAGYCTSGNKRRVQQ